MNKVDNEISSWESEGGAVRPAGVRCNTNIYNVRESSVTLEVLWNHHFDGGSGVARINLSNDVRYEIYYHEFESKWYATVYELKPTGSLLKKPEWIRSLHETLNSKDEALKTLAKKLRADDVVLPID